jgi:hypothetical protein
MTDQIQRLAKVRRSKKLGTMLEPVDDFQPNAPRLHINGDLCVVTINGASKGLVRRLGAGMFLWSNINGEGRSNTEEEAYCNIGFRIYRNFKGKQCLQEIGGKIVTELNL